MLRAGMRCKLRSRSQPSLRLFASVLMLFGATNLALSLDQVVDVRNCSQLQSRIDRSEAGDVLLLETYLDCTSESANFQVVHTLTLGPRENSSEQTTIYAASNGTLNTLNVSAGATVRIQSLRFIGHWQIHVAKNSSLEFIKVNIESATMRIDGGAVRLERCGASRLNSNQDIALEIVASNASIHMQDCAFSDDKTGTLLSISGDSNKVVLRNILVKANDSATATSHLGLSKVTGFALRGSNLLVSITNSSFSWCRLRALFMLGEKNRLEIDSSVFFQNKFYLPLGNVD